MGGESNWWNGTTVTVSKRAQRADDVLVKARRMIRYGVGLIVATLILSSMLAYGLGHIGRVVRRPAGLKGCRGHWIEDISCCGVFFPESFVFSSGLSLGFICISLGFWHSWQVLMPALGPSLAKLTSVLGIFGCTFGVGMACISMRTAVRSHLVLAMLAIACWFTCCGLRVASRLPPKPYMAALLLALAIIFLNIWVMGIWTKVACGWAEWIGMICLLANLSLFPRRSDPCLSNAS